jgi:phage terminase large subunit GpA-like protein
MSYEAIAEDAINAEKSESSRKDFSNLVLGLPYRFRGDAPDHMRLMERREDYRRAHIPPGALLVSVACDVQMRGIYFEVLAVAPDRRTWVIDAGYLDGETTDHDSGAFVELTDLYHRKWPDAFGNAWRADEFGIDANYHTGAVYEWTRRHPGTKALQGRDGWGRPALGVATDQDVDYKGKKIKGGAKLRGVGTWPLKSTFYAYLGLTAKADGTDLIYPHGFCHFGSFLDETYFKQITSEYLAEEKVRGRKSQVWKIRGHAENHFLDCRIYNMALIDPYLASFTPDDWAARAAERGLPQDMRTPDLFTPRPFGREAKTPADDHERPRDPFAQLAEINRGM